jgi:hypothetical protein
LHQQFLLVEIFLKLSGADNVAFCCEWYQSVRRFVVEYDYLHPAFGAGHPI